MASRFALPLWLNASLYDGPHRRRVIEIQYKNELQAALKTRKGWRWIDQALLDDVHCWSVFTMYWPGLATCALVGLMTEEVWAPVQREWPTDVSALLAAVSDGPEPQTG